jgi:hypothetical protein
MFNLAAGADRIRQRHSVLHSSARHAGHCKFSFCKIETSVGNDFTAFIQIFSAMEP